MDSQEIPRETLVLQSSLELIDVEAVMKMSRSLKSIKAYIKQVVSGEVSVAVRTSSHGMGGWRDGWTDSHHAWITAAAGCSLKGSCASGQSFGLSALEKS